MSAARTKTWSSFRRVTSVRPVAGEDGTFTFAVALEGLRSGVAVDAFTLMNYEFFRAAVLTQTGRPFRDAWVESGRVSWEEVIVPRWAYDDGQV